MSNGKDIEAQVKDFVRMLMKREKYTQAQLADEIGVEPPTVSRWLNGETKFRQENFLNLLAFLGFDLVDYIHYKFDPPQPVVVDGTDLRVCGDEIVTDKTQIDNEYRRELAKRLIAKLEYTECDSPEMVRIKALQDDKISRALKEIVEDDGHWKTCYPTGEEVFMVERKVGRRSGSHKSPFDWYKALDAVRKSRK